MDNKPEAKKVGRTIANLRKKQNLTQSALAEKLYVSDKAVSRWETGEGLPEILNLMELSKIFNVSLEYILKGEGADGLEQENIITEQKQQTHPEQKVNSPSTQTITSLVLSSISLLAHFLGFSIASIVLSIIALVLAAKAEDKGSDLNKLAKVLSIISLALAIVLVAISVVALLIFGSYFNSIFNIITEQMAGM